VCYWQCPGWDRGRLGRLKLQVHSKPKAKLDSLECADLSALWPDFEWRRLLITSRRRAATDQSGDRSPHSKELPHSQ
jgi:hypothetical protein